MWIPLLLAASRSPQEHINAAWCYVAATAVLWAIPYSSRVWTNRLWQRGLRGLFGAHHVQWGEQIVLVTGGAHGIGKALVDTLAVRHVVVVSLDRKKQDYDWDDVYSYECDVSDREQVMAVAEKIRKEVGDPTILVNNAGVVRPELILEADPKGIATTFEVNAQAHYWTAQAFLPNMIQQNAGHVITIASALSYNGAARMASYSASKAAAMSFHESLRAELIHDYNAPNVRTTVVCPGLVQTGLFDFINYNTSVQHFIAPPLAAHNLVKDIIHAIDAEESRTICKPYYVNLLWTFRGAPSWFGDFVKWFGNYDRAVQSDLVKPPGDAAKRRKASDGQRASEL